ncbi:MAG TPA: PKD domain-containing protein [Chitinophagaceae bacterium]
MNTIFYPWSVPYHNRYGTAQLILPARKNSLFFLRHYLQRFHLKFLSLFVAALFFVASSATGQGPCPSSNCTSGDIRITKVELIKADGTALPNFCTPGVDLQVKLRVTFEVTSKTRYGFLVVANILINGNSIGTIAHCNPGTFAKGLHTMDVSTLSNGNAIIWPCGSAIQLKDVYTAWDQQVATASHPGICTYLTSNGTITDCATINPKCKFYGANEPILIVAPLIANFTAQEGSCNGLKRSWTFTSTTTGGTPPYTYTWNFGDGTAPLVTTQNPVTHDYAYSVTGNVNVTLSVKDASTPTNKTSSAQPQTISVTSCCTASTVPTDASAASPSICSGGSTSVSVIGGSLGTGASWKWYIGGCANGTSIGTGSSINVNPTTTTTYYVRAEGDCGTTACASVTVTVKTPSTNPTSASAISAILCLGQSTDLSVTGGSLGTNASWKWYAGGCGSGASIGTGPSITVTPTVTTTYYVRAEGDCNNTSCASVVVTVKTLSTAPTGAMATQSTICSGGSTNLSVTGGSLGTNSAWKWYAGGCGSGASIGTGPSINVNPTTTTTYYVRAEGDCGNTTCASVTVTVKNPSNNPTGASAVSSILCQGQSTDLGVTGGSLGTNASWKWYAGGCASGPSIGTGPSITVTPSATTTYYVRAEGDCNNTSCASVVVTVKTLSSAPSGASAASPSICIGGNTNLSVVGGSLGTGASWKWYKDGCASGASIGTGAMISVNPTQTTTYFVRAEGDCNNTACASVQVSVNPASFGGTLASDRTICAGSNVGLLSLTGNIGSIVRWEYSGTNAVGSYSAIGSTAATLTVGALYQDMWFRVVVKNGACSEATSNAIKITLQWPIANNYIGSAQTICAGNTPAALDGYTPTGGDGSYSYQWQRRTTGSWSNISGATGFGYAPGPITENTEFRRVVSTSGACSSNPSNVVLISISPESQVYPISKTNFCQTAPNTGKVKLMDSYQGVSYQLKKASDNSNVHLPKIGTGDALEWTGLAAGTYYIYGTGLAPTYCTSRTTNVTIYMFDCTEFYTLSQGGFGNNGGSCLGSNAVNTIMALLGNTDLVIGTTNSVTIPATIEGATKLNQVLPGGSGANALPAGNCVITSGCFVSPTYLTSGGKINNGLLSQTIVMSLNSRWNNNALLLFPIRSGYLTTQEMNGCYPNTTPSENCDIVSIQINPNVVSYLGPNATVADLLQLANDVLGGTKTPGINGVPSYSDISGALNSLVVAFHDGRRFLNYYDTQQGCELLTGSAAIETTAANTATSIAAEKEKENRVTVTAFPNPFTDNINFQIETKQSGQGTLEVYNITGQKIKTVFSGYMNAGKQRFSMNVPAGQSSVLFYVFRMGSQKISGKLLHKGGR